MPRQSDERAWLSEYLYFAGPIYDGECDRVILDVVEPFVRRCQEHGWIDAWFFIRYSEHGSHVRLRLHGAPDVLEREVAPALRAHAGSLYPDVGEGLPAEPVFSGEGAMTHVANVAYEPETDRYGGPHAIGLAEDFFERSSDAAMALLHKTKLGERSSRLGKGLLAMVITVHVFSGTREAGAEFGRSYGTNYLRTLVPDEEARSAWLGAFDSGFEAQAANLTRYVDDVWERLDEGDPLSDTLDRYHADLLEIRDQLRTLAEAGQVSRGETALTWEQAVQMIVPSYVHMMSNRLGVNIQEESYLAYLISRALGQAPHAAAAGAAEETGA
jgi:thiopeptide-type bacteriocin biosynthesis protein